MPFFAQAISNPPGVGGRGGMVEFQAFASGSLLFLLGGGGPPGTMVGGGCRKPARLRILSSDLGDSAVCVMRGKRRRHGQSALRFGFCRLRPEVHPKCSARHAVLDPTTSVATHAGGVSVTEQRPDDDVVAFCEDETVLVRAGAGKAADKPNSPSRTGFDGGLC